MQCKTKSRRSSLKIMARLVILLDSLSYVMLLAVINGTLGHISAMGVTFMGAVGVAKYLGEAVFMSYNLIIGLAIGFGIMRGILRYLEQYSNHYIAFKLLAVLRDKLFTSLRLLAPAKLDIKKKGSIISTITSDIETLEVFYAHTISPIFIAVLNSVFVLLLVGFISTWYLSLVAFLSYIIIGLVVPYLYSKKINKTGVEYRQELSEFNAFYLESIKGVKEIVINNDAANRIKMVDEKTAKLEKNTKIIKRASHLFSSVTELIVALTIIAVLIVSIALVKLDYISFGKTLMGSVAIFGSFGPLIALSALPGNLTQTFASGDRILDLIEEKPMVETITNKADINFESLSVKNLCFNYEKENEVLNNISLTIKKGQIIGLSGESGCGKSTILKLLLRFFKSDSGSIKYNGIDIDEINTESLLDNISMISQTTYLFDTTIKDNILIGKQDASMSEVVSASKNASIHDFIMSLPDKYDTKVGFLGENLSAGERQRIGLARAFISKSQLILLDEPTSNVDSINEGIILQSLLNQRDKLSFILVSHRESTMSVCDTVYKIKDGEVTSVYNN